MTFQRGKLIINEEPYQKAVKVPTAKDILRPDDALFDKAKELDIVKGVKETHDASKFASYAVAVQDHADVQAALTKMRLKFADATHVACAFRLPGANTPINQDFIDDGEFGCGRIMLKVLKEQQLLNIAVFIVRYYGGKHLGAQRHNIFHDMAAKAIQELMKKRAQENSQKEASSPLPERYKNPFPIEDVEPEVEDWSNEEEKDVNKKSD